MENDEEDGGEEDVVARPDRTSLLRFGIPRCSVGGDDLEIHSVEDFP